MTTAPCHRFFLWSTLLIAPVSGFQSVVAPARLLQRVSSARLSLLAEQNLNSGKWSYPPEFHRAVECAKGHALCDVDELLRLADELEQYNGCMLEWEVDMTDESGDNDADVNDCEKETMDRLDIADLLRTEGEMIERRETIEFSNVFKEKVEDDEREADLPPDIINFYTGFYECVYSKTCGP